MKTPSAVAVVGMACHYPGAKSPRELWENILARRRAFRRFLECRMPERDYFSEDPSAPDRTYGKQGAFLDGFEFDRAKWRVPASTFASTDISHWLALEVASSALKDAGHTGGEGLPRERTGVILGNTLTGEVTRANVLRLRWPFISREFIRAAHETGLDSKARDTLLAAAKDRFLAHFPPIDEDSLAGGLSNTIAGRICGAFDFGGGGYVVDGACASSLLAICTAAAALEEGRVDACLAGGVDISMDPFELVGFAKARALSPTEMRVYDRRGNGFIPGEGCAFVLLKRLEDALSAGNRIYALLRGWGISSDGRNAITAPKVSGQARAIRRAWERGGRPDFVEGHGTGTALGDRVELEAIASALGASDTPDHTIGVTSLKSILGHTKAAAGIGAFCKAVMAVNQRVFPPTSGCDEPNAVFTDKARGLFPIRRGQVRELHAPLRAGVSAMGFGGINAHVVLESHGPPDASLKPSLPEKALFVSEQSAELFVFGGETLSALRAQVEAFHSSARDLALAELADFSAELCTRLPRRPAYRAAIVAHSPEALCLGMEQLLRHDALMGPKVWLQPFREEPRIAFLCPGQGSQLLEMTRVLLARDPGLWTWAETLAAEAKEAGCEGLLEAIFPDLDRILEQEQLSALKKRLAQSELAQPAICLCTLLWAERLKKLGISPMAAAGHSLGELCAAAIAGAISPQTLMRLAVKRGRAMAAPGDRPGKMASLDLNAEQARALIGRVSGYLAIANINGPKQTVVSGEGHAIDALVELAEKEQIAVRRLSVSNAFHSRLVQAASEELRRDQEIPEHPNRPHTPILSSLLPDILDETWNFRAHVADHILAPVDFVSLVRRVAQRCDLMIEVGPGRVLSGLVGSILQNEGPSCLPVEAHAGDESSLLCALASAFVLGGDLRWEALHAGRLIRPFIAPRERVFIVNPCESGEKSEQSMPLPKEASPQSPPSPPASPKSLPSVALSLESLLELVARRVGFDRASLSGEQRLQDDLNLDSIKAGEIVAEAARLAGVAGRIDPVQYVHHRLEDIAKSLGQIAEQNGAQPRAATQESPPQASLPPVDHAPTWTRVFGLGLRKAEWPNPNKGLQGRRVRVLAQEPEAWMPAFIQAGAQRDETSPDTVVAVLGASPSDLGACVRELHAMAAALSPELQTLLVLQGSGGRFGQGNEVFGSSAQAFARSIFLERPKLGVYVLDFAPSIETRVQAQKAAELLGALGAGPGFQAWGIEAEGIWTPEAHVLQPAEMPKASTNIGPGEVLLVTGGARGITAVCAHALALATGAQLVLWGSTPKEKADEEMLRCIGKMALDGIRAEYMACDLGDREAVRAGVDLIQKRIGPIAGLIHGAARNTPKRVEQVSLEEALQEIRPKLGGCLHLMEALESAPPRLFVALSSIIGVSGMQGNAWYAFANEALDHALARFSSRHPQCRPLSVAFGVWKDVGMGQKLGSVPALARMGIGALDPEEGAQRFVHLVLHDPGVRQPIVTAHLDGLATWPTPLANDPKLAFLGGELKGVAGVACRARLKLHPEQHDFIRDHVFRDTMLLPTVFGLEAMAQAAWSARSNEQSEIVTAIDNLRLDAPVTVGPEGAEIEVRALVREDTPNLVDCELRTAQTGFSKAHFAATLRFASSADIAQKMEFPDLRPPSEEIDPKSDLYGGLLFQGPSFQRIEHIEGAGERALRFLGTSKPPQEQRFLLGDPYFRDALLQAGQLLVSHDDALPVHIQHIAFAGEQRYGARKVLATLDASDERSHWGSVWVCDTEGRLVERIEGYQLRILSHDPDRPSLEQIMHPAEQDEARLRAQIEAICQFRGHRPPHFILRREALHSLPREQRRTRMAAAVGPMLGTAKLSWDEEQRPRLGDGRGISFSHDPGYWLAMLSPTREQGALGCDLEAIMVRDAWPELTQQRALLQALRSGGDDLNTAGTRLWALREALHKAGAGEGRLSIEYQHGGVVEFLSEAQGRRFQALSLKFSPSRGPKRILVWAFPSAETRSSQPLIDTESHRVRVRNERPLRMETRFVVTFDESAGLGGRVPIYTLASWMGRLRELALTNIRHELLEHLDSRKYGMVTQEAWIEQSHELSALDRMEATTWVEALRPSTCLLRFEFSRLDKEGPRFAGRAAQRFGWVDVLGHGQVRAAPFPPILKSFLEALHRTGDSLNTPEPMLLPQGSPWLKETVQTGLTDSNVVGNLYYAHYFRWPHRLIDRFLWEHQPDLIKGRGSQGELVFSTMHLEFLREAMPFDPIEISLHAEPKDKETLRFSVLYERVEPGGERTRLALGRMSGRWVERASAGSMPKALPEFLRTHIHLHQSQATANREIQR